MLSAPGATPESSDCLIRHPEPLFGRISATHCGERTVATGQNERINKQLLLKQVPEGISGPEDFEVREAAAPEPGPGELLIEAHYIGVDAALRLITRNSDEFLFRVKPGDLVHGSIAGKVIE